MTWRLFGRSVPATFRLNGTVDKYIGDAIMVHFGTPKPAPDDPIRPLDCARDMAPVAASA